MRAVGRAGCVIGLCLCAWACGSSDATAENGDAGMRKPDSGANDSGRGGQTPAAHGGNGGQMPAAHGGNGAQAGNTGPSGGHSGPGSGSGAGASGMPIPNTPHARVTFRLTGVE